MSNIAMTEPNTVAPLSASPTTPGRAIGVRESGLTLSPSAPARVRVPAQPRRIASARRRRIRVNWEAMAVILLMLACTALCVYRLLWDGTTLKDDGSD